MRCCIKLHLFKLTFKLVKIDIQRMVLEKEIVLSQFTTLNLNKVEIEIFINNLFNLSFAAYSTQKVANVAALFAQTKNTYNEAGRQ